jgi:hypothetical protein
VIILLLGIDVLLDIQSFVSLSQKWPSWALLLRLTCGIGYLTIFMVYVGLGRVFTPGYSYWGIESGFAGPIVYLFLWLIGYVVLP